MSSLPVPHPLLTMQHVTISSTMGPGVAVDMPYLNPSHLRFMQPASGKTRPGVSLSLSAAPLLHHPHPVHKLWKSLMFEAPVLTVLLLWTLVVVLRSCPPPPHPSRPPLPQPAFERDQ